MAHLENSYIILVKEYKSWRRNRKRKDERRYIPGEVGRRDDSGYVCVRHHGIGGFSIDEWSPGVKVDLPVKESDKLVQSPEDIHTPF